MKRIFESKHGVTVICYSCLTGKAVWLYRGPSRGAANVAYWRACKKEIEYVRQWPRYVAERKAFYEGILNGCLASLPIDAELTPSQKAAAKVLRKLADEKLPCYMEFYNHIMEERRRREEDREIRRQMRERERLEKLNKK
jgi:hypothetical protein